jgi:hypothetical protein
MHAIAFICTSAAGPAQGVIVQISDKDGHVIVTGITNADGYVLFNFIPINVPIDVYFWGPGYKNHHVYIVLGDTNQNYPITLEPSFSKPSRERIINVKANLCNLYDAGGNPIFEPMISWLIMNDKAKADDWIAMAIGAGSTHYNLAIACNYRNNPVPGTDFTQDLSSFATIINYIRSKNLIPIVKLAFDGQRFDPVGLTYGWQWGMDNIERIANQLSSFNELILWSTGFDGCFPDWTPDQTTNMLRKMRSALGNKACIDTEFAGPASETWGYTHMGNGAGDWTPDKLGILDHFSLEAQQFPIDVTVGLRQIGTRLLGPKAINCPPGPYYLAGLDKEIAIDVYETVATWFYNGGVATSQDAINAANAAKGLGFSVFGNGVPTV